MAKTVTAKFETAASQSITKPRYLLEITWDTGPVRLSSREQVTWNGLTWSGNYIEDIKLSISNGVASTTNVQLSNHDNLIGSLGLLYGLADKQVKIWSLYGDSPYVFDDALLIFDGYLDGGTITQQRVTIRCSSTGARLSPSIYCLPPLFNHLTPANTKIVWNGNIFILEE